VIGIWKVVEERERERQTDFLRFIVCVCVVKTLVLLLTGFVDVERRF
jgi:hypothetical protein